MARACCPHTTATPSLNLPLLKPETVTARGLAQRVELADTPQMRFVVIVFLALSAISLAQQGSDKQRASRMVFPPGAMEPAASPTQPSAQRGFSNPSEAMDAFFLALKAGRVDAAYDALVKDSIIADRREDVAGLKKRTQEALDNYGPVSGYETLDEKIVGTSLLRRTCISLNSDLPLRWRFYFYKSEGAWKLVDLRVDDGLVELFEEAGRARK
jgi:hypothetical protein